MKMSPMLVLALAMLSTAVAIGDKVSPVEKVIELLAKLKDECAEAGAKDAASYDAFACFCKNTADNKLTAITKSKEKIESAEAKIEMLDGEIDELNGAITDAKDKKKELEKEQKEADEKRKEEFEEYSEKEKDLAGAIKAVGGAIKALEDSKDNMKDSKLSLVDLAKVAEHAQSGRFTVSPKQVEALLEIVAASTAPGDPHASQFASNEIIQTLKDLQKTFKTDKVDLDTTEADKRQTYEMEKQARENTIQFTQDDIDKDSKSVADKEEDLEQTTEQMEEEKDMKKADKEFLDELTKQGEQKAKDFDQRSKSRAGELTALSEALEILKSGVQENANANKKLTGFLSTDQITNKQTELIMPAHEDRGELQRLAPVQDHQTKLIVVQAKLIVGQAKLILPAREGVSFLQVREEASGPTKVLDFLSEQATKIKSPLLSTLAMKIKYGVAKDHFVKIRGIINDLIKKLKEDAEAEAEQKGFCDEEMGKATDARDEANGEVEGTTADIDDAESNIAMLTEDIGELAKQIADLRKGLFEATELRAKEKADNAQVVKMSKEGKEAVSDAIDVLKKFYEFVQVGFTPKGAGRDGKTVGDMAPKGVEGEYEGNKDAAKGILGLLDVILDDFKGTVKATEEAEDKAKEEFKSFKKDTEDDLDKKAGDKKDKEGDKKKTEADLVGFREDLKNHKDSLEIALEELAKLKPLCIDTGLSWAEKRARQKQEIEALKQALTILEDWKN